jgi:hypothetical protein
VATQQKQLNIRASNMAAALKCPGSVRDGLMVDPWSDAPLAGISAHEVMAMVLKQDLDDLPGELVDICDAYGADPDDVRMLCYACLRHWRDIQELFPDPLYVENTLSMKIGDQYLTGTPDFYSIIPDEGDTTAGWVNVGDWKSGFLDVDPVEQMFTYFALIRRNHPETNKFRFRGYVIHPRLGRTDTDIDASWVTIQKFTNRIESEVMDWDGAYHPGDHCNHCPLALTCEARSSYVHSIIRDVMGDEAATKAKRAVTQLAVGDKREEAGAYLAQVLAVGKDLTARLESMRDIVRSNVELAGPLPIGEGRSYNLTPTKRVSVDLPKAWSHLSKNVDARTMLGRLKMSRSALERMLKKEGKTPDQIKRLVKSLDEDLDALHESSFTQLRIVRAALTKAGPKARKQQKGQ